MTPTRLKMLKLLKKGRVEFEFEAQLMILHKKTETGALLITEEDRILKLFKGPSSSTSLSTNLKTGRYEMSRTF